MDRVFQRNMDALDKEDLKKAVDQLDEYVRYMKEQIEWAVQVLLRMESGTSSGEIVMRLSKLEKNVTEINRGYALVSDAIQEISTALEDKADTSDVVLKDDLVTEIDSYSTDSEVPTAKAVYDLFLGV